MSAIVKVAVLAFVSLLCMVCVIGVFGMLVTPKAEMAAEGMDLMRWRVNLTNPVDPAENLIYVDEQEYLERPPPVRRIRELVETEDTYAKLASQSLAGIQSLKGTYNRNSILTNAQHATFRSSSMSSDGREGQVLSV